VKAVGSKDADKLMAHMRATLINLATAVVPAVK
jgi:hypothetical protein